MSRTQLSGALSSQPANVYNPVDYVFFYSHKGSDYGYGPEHANTVNEACFSNWYYQPYQAFRADDSSPLVFCCNEQEMMYRKAHVFEDYAVANVIMATQLRAAVIEVLFGESLKPSMAQRTGSSGAMAQRAGFTVSTPRTSTRTWWEASKPWAERWEARPTQRS